ncbi:MAG TPA: type II toxin-antitoxin system VapC family toxin [Bosea sp. (in: a-proteobacteria)]|nr:type II toxin-antitoxin system VapC family toxin [Bosea sp. (in: a-proteobacteria)]
MSLVVDTSAIVAIVMEEPEAADFIAALASARTRILTSVNLLEAQIVLTFGKGMPAETAEVLVARENIEIIPFDEDLSGIAFDAYRRYGKGRHPAKLNMGDCAAYALAKSRGWPLLYKGDDFTQTDIERA